MTAEQLFSILNVMTMAAWLPLVFLPRARWAATVVPVAIPLLLAIIYVVLVAATLPRSEGGFSSLAGVRSLFGSPWALLAGWTHYLAFDLFIGGWEVRDAQQRGISHLLIVPALVLTFLFGPAGLLLYLAIRWWRPRGPFDRTLSVEGSCVRCACSVLQDCAAWVLATVFPGAPRRTIRRIAGQRRYS